MKAHVRITERLSGIIGMILFSAVLVAQDAGRESAHSLSFSPGFSQIRDEFNYGLVNNGLNLVGAYSFVSSSDRNRFLYRTELGFGINYRQGLGMTWTLKPFDLCYGFLLNSNPDLSVTLGPYAAGYYMWQLYPELQSGQMFWLSSYEIGPKILISLPVKSKMMNLSFATSIASLNSRPEVQTETYFYSLTLADFAKNVHSNMQFGSVNLFNHIVFALELKDPGKKFSFGYEFGFIGYSDAPAFRFISHSIMMNWKIGNNK